MRWLLLVSSIIGTMTLLAGCAEAQPGSAKADVSGISRAYHRAFQQNHHRTVRKPHSDTKKRAMRQIAAVASQRLAEMDSVRVADDPRLVSPENADSAEIGAKTVEYREALTVLRESASRQDEHALRMAYLRVQVIHDELSELRARSGRNPR